MKDWAKPYVLQRTAETLAESVKDEAEREQWLVLKSKVLEDEEVVYDELTSCLNCQFGNEVGDPQDFFYRVFGSVLADLPEEVFKTLCGIKNLFFLFSPKPRAETKTFELKNDIKEGELLQVVVFPSASGSLPQMVLRGEIVRELVQAYTSLGIIIEGKDRIDSIAIGWGFREEIKAVREYKKEKG